MIGGRRAERNAEVLAGLGLQHSAHELNVADEASVRDAIAATVRRYGRLDILINNAAIGQRASVMMRLRYVLATRRARASLQTWCAARVRRSIRLR